MKQKLGIIFFVFMFMLIPFRTMAADDITGHWAEGDIRALIKTGVMNGKAPGVYDPNGVVKRAEFAAFIARGLQLPEGGPSTFTDVIGHWGERDILRVYAAGIINGRSATTFDPNAQITRAEMAAMLSRALHYKGVAVEPKPLSFADNAAISPTYAGYVEHVVGAGLIIGDNQNRFNPSKSANRAESAAVINRLLKLTGYPPEVAKFVVLDPGHGGNDPGAVGVNGTKEKDIVLDVALRAQKYFANTPYNVLLTRDTDIFLELPQRVDFAIRNGASAFVSIHTNAYDGTASGIETYYYGTQPAAASAFSLDSTDQTSVEKSTNPYVEESKELAACIQNRLVTYLGLPNRGTKGDRGFFVIKENNMPAVLTELGFIDNRTDYAKLSDPNVREGIAKEIYNGVLDYFDKKVAIVKIMVPFTMLSFIFFTFANLFYEIR